MLEVNLPVVPQDHKVKTASLSVFPFPRAVNPNKQEIAYGQEKQVCLESDSEACKGLNTDHKRSSLTNINSDLRKGNGSLIGSRFFLWSGDDAA